jgi:hypothetical protein
MPKLNPRGDVICGVAGIQGSLNGVSYPFASVGRGCWLDDETILVALKIPGEPIYRWRPFEDPSGQALTLVDARTYNAIAGGRGRWAACIQGNPSLLYGTLGDIPKGGAASIAFDGTFLYPNNYPNDYGLTIIAPDGTWWADLPSGIALWYHALPGGQAIWPGGAHGRPVPRPTLAAVDLRLAELAGEAWLLYWSEGRGIILQPDGSPDGYVIGLSNGFENDLQIVDGVLTAVLGLSQGEGPNDYLKLEASRAGARYVGREGPPIVWGALVQPPDPPEHPPTEPPTQPPTEPPVEPPSPEQPKMIPHIGNDEIIELAKIYHGTEPAKRKEEPAYLRDGAYYGLGYTRNRTELAHGPARDRYAAAAGSDAYYDPPPPAMFTDNEVIDVSARFVARYTEIGRFLQQSREENNRDQTYYGITYARQRESKRSHEDALRQMERLMCADFGVPDPYPPEPSKITGRIRVDAGGFRTDAGPFAVRGMSDFGAIAHVLKGRRSVIERRADRYAACGRTVVRIAGMLGHESWIARDLGFSPRDPGYWEAAAETLAIYASRGIYVEWFFFADAQIVVPDAAEREAWLRQWAAFVKDRPEVFPSLSNEPFKNGWENCVDPALLRLADIFAGIVGHRDFSIGDPGDVVNDPETGDPLWGEWETCSQRSNVLVTHPNRDQPPPPDKRFRRWVDHLEGFTELPPVSNQIAAIYLNEPMGAHPVYQNGRRDNDPDALAAGQFVAACVGYGFCFHWIPEEDGQCDVMELPGLTPEIAEVLVQIPAGPDWSYQNDTWQAAPTEGIAWDGLEGKLRHRVRNDGREAWSVAYGETDFDRNVRWKEGWTPVVRYRGPRICVWQVTR